VPRYNWLNPSTTASTLRQDGTSVPYENARYLDNLVYNGISCPDLEQERSSLLQLKLDILTSLASDIRNGTSANSWEQCYAVLAEAVSVEHISYLLSTDAVYLHGSRHWPADASLKLDFQSSPGGIANLLIVICHITAESKYPTFTNELLALFRRDDLNLGDGFTYFSVCNTNDRLKVDRVLDAFLSAVAKQAPIWQSSERHINAKLAESPNNSATRFPLASLFLPNPLRHHIACLTRAERQTPPMPHAESDHTLIPTSHPVTADKPFNARHHEVLDVLSRKGVNSSSKALKAAQIARCMKPCCTASSLKRILKRLKTVGYIDAKEGTGGGYWITGEGVSFIESEKQRNAPTLKQRYSQ
jgi:predicted transcriptional regulator